MFVFLGFFAWISAAGADGDRLFPLMQGHWTGTGARQYLSDGTESTLSVEVDTSSEILGGRPALVSRNQWVETLAQGTPRTYLSNYWIESAPLSGTYQLGYLGSEKVSSTGVFGTDGIFRVDQQIGGGSEPMVVHSETQFLPEGTLYTETFSIGAQIVTRTRIEYRRAAPQ